MPLVITISGGLVLMLIGWEDVSEVQAPPATKACAFLDQALFVFLGFLDVDPS